jgi:hypothetical protein
VEGSSATPPAMEEYPVEGSFAWRYTGEDAERVNLRTV